MGKLLGSELAGKGNEFLSVAPLVAGATEESAASREGFLLDNMRPDNMIMM